MNGNRLITCRRFAGVEHFVLGVGALLVVLLVVVGRVGRRCDEAEEAGVVRVGAAEHHPPSGKSRQIGTCGTRERDLARGGCRRSRRCGSRAPDAEQHQRVHLLLDAQASHAAPARQTAVTAQLKRKTNIGDNELT